MILIDTNVISELMRPTPDAKVLAWVDAQVVETLYLSAITVAELRYGLAALPSGKRRQIFQDRLEGEFLGPFSGRILPFDDVASRVYAELMAQARNDGKPISKEDGYIAAIAHAHKMKVATRDELPFLSAGIAVVNPWSA